MTSTRGRRHADRYPPVPSTADGVPHLPWTWPLVDAVTTTRSSGVARAVVGAIIGSVLSAVEW